MFLCDAWDTATLYSEEELAEGDPDVGDTTALGLGGLRPHRPRGSVFSWSLVQPAAADAPDWTLPDHAVREAGARGRAVLGTLQGLADPGEGDGPVITLAPPAEQLPAWSEYVRQVVERYDGDGVDDMPGLAIPVAAWEVGNEPNSDPDTLDLGGPPFLEWIAATYTAAKEASPTTPVLVGGAGPVLTQQGEVDRWTEGLYRWFFEHGGGEYTDAFNFHTLVGVPSPEVGQFLDQWEPIVGELPLWLGEVGTRSPNVATYWASDEAEVTWMIDTLDVAYARGVRRVGWCRGGYETADIPGGVLQALTDYAGRIVE
jgi:hypothetical protein